MVLHLLGLKLICQVFSSPLTAVGPVAAVAGRSGRSFFIFLYKSRGGVCKQSDVGELDSIRKIVGVSQEQKRSPDCTLGYTRQDWSRERVCAF